MCRQCYGTKSVDDVVKRANYCLLTIDYLRNSIEFIKCLMTERHAARANSIISQCFRLRRINRQLFGLRDKVISMLDTCY